MIRGQCSPDKNDNWECHPIQNLNDVLNWSPPSTSNWSELVKPLKKRTSFCLNRYDTCRNYFDKLNFSPVPKTLVCHDMKGGYLNDRFVKGHSNLKDYKYVNWANIDTFVYFSHHFLTIPPLTWINAGHLHGVKVLGTILTEGKIGEGIWETIFNKEDVIEKLTKNLALICEYYGFDGYLLNIENKVFGPLLDCVTILNALLKSTNPNYLLIWYDAVTISGELKWQNALNFKNRDFFDACDGIFLNYGWTEQLLDMSVSYAGDRVRDVYVGIDVFGRGVFEGGGFSTWKAFEVIRKYNLSAAIFAPGWVYENCGKEEIPECRDFKFWSSISSYLYTYGPGDLPFETSFCRGYGFKTFKEGLVVAEEPWFDQSQISHLPAQLSGLHGVEDECCLSYYDKDGYSGGGCLLVSQKENSSHNHIDWLPRGGSEPAAPGLRNLNKSQELPCLLVCDFIAEPGHEIAIKIFFKPFLKNNECAMNLVLTTGTTVQCKQIEANLRNHSFSVCSNGESKMNGWYYSSFQLDLGNEHLYKVGCELTGEHHTPVLIGCLQIHSIC